MEFIEKTQKENSDISEIIKGWGSDILVSRGKAHVRVDNLYPKCYSILNRTLYSAPEMFNKRKYLEKVYYNNLFRFFKF